jgi:hypothetical protein
MTKEYYIEIVKEKFCGHIINSEVRKATKEEVDNAKSQYLAGKCEHILVQDSNSYLYDARSCDLCGKGLGAI